MRSKIACRVLVVLSVCMFLASMPLEAIATGWPGWGVLLLGWLEPLCIQQVGPFVAFGWLANPLLFAAWLATLVGERRLALACAGTGLVVGALVLLGHRVVHSEDGGASPLEHGPGYWCWLVALMLGVVGAALVPRKT